MDRVVFAGTSSVRKPARSGSAQRAHVGMRAELIAPIWAHQSARTGPLFDS